MRNKAYKKRKIAQKNIARKRIVKLFQMAEKNAHLGKLDLSTRYVEIARKLSMRYLVPIPKEYKRCFCKNCYIYMLPSVTCRVRIHRRKIILQCLNCKKISRFPIGKAKSTSVTLK